MDDVEVKNLSDSITALGIAGPKSREVLAAAGIAIPETKPLQIFEVNCTCDCDCIQCTAVRAEDAAHESYELWLAPGDVRKTWDALVSHGATPVGSEALEVHRIASGIPLYGVDIRERDLPQETEQVRALNFNKGCYVGQEIVERIRSRGAVHRKFCGFLFEGIQAVAAGTKIVSGEKEVGEVTSATTVRFPNAEKTVALGYVRREIANPGRELMIGGVNATIVPLPVPEALRTQDRGTPVARPA
jgi:folate-binding protein YgfZ